MPNIPHNNHFSDEDNAEFERYSQFMEEFIKTPAILSLDPAIIASIVKLVTFLSQEAVPPDLITAQAFRTMAEMLEHSVKRLGKEPNICTIARQLSTMHPSSDRSSWDSE